MLTRCFVFALFFTVCSVAPPCFARRGGDVSAHLPAAQDLAFNQFYVMPVGPRGLQPTRQLLALRGQRVRLIGYMVHEEEPLPGVFLLAPQPLQLSEVADGPADDLPATTVFVHLPVDEQPRVIAFRPGPWELTGTLELGAQAERNQRVSYTRLRLDSPVVRPERHAQPPS